MSRTFKLAALTAAVAAAFAFASAGTSEAAAKKKAKGPTAITAPMCGLGLLDASGTSRAPVCGTKGGMKFTYNNACFAEKDGAKNIKAGACATKGAKKAKKKSAKKKG
ncbi:MAG: hypothetical protein KF697_00210 [Pseudolabrys sp.]|nr:hypothetical protein [Pseudolabrys sp.]